MTEIGFLSHDERNEGCLVKTYVPIRIPPDLLARMMEKAKQAGHTRSSYIRWLIEKDLRKVAPKG